MDKYNSIIPGTSGAIIRDEHLHVWRSRYGWKASGKEGDFGIGETRTKAIAIAADASATGHGGRRQIRIYTFYGRHEYTIKKTDQRPSNQAFQDDVP